MFTAIAEGGGAVRKHAAEQKFTTPALAHQALLPGQYRPLISNKKGFQPNEYMRKQLIN